MIPGKAERSSAANRDCDSGEPTAPAAARRLCTVLGVGPVTTAAVVATLDDVSRFASAGQADRAPSGRPDAQPNSNRPPSAAGVTENSGRTSLTAASTAA